MAVCFLTRETSKKVWHKSYTSGHCLVLNDNIYSIKEKIKYSNKYVLKERLNGNKSVLNTYWKKD